MEQSKPAILCVDDNKDNCELLAFLFGQEGYQTVACETLEECSIEIRKRDFRAVILDYRFGETTSLEICEEVRDFDSNIPIIFYSGESRQKEIEKALASGANAYLKKPLDFPKLIPTVTELINKSELIPGNTVH